MAIKKELNSLIYAFLVQEECFETAAYFMQDISYQVDIDAIKLGTKLQDIVIQYRKYASKQITSRIGQQHKATEVASTNDSDSDNFESDTASPEKDVQNNMLPSSSIVKNRKRVELQLFREYKNHFGDLRVPQKFSVPYESSWSHKYHGVSLGRIVDSIRQSIKRGKLDYCEDELNELLEMGFIVDILKDKDERIVLAFQIFIAKYGHADVPYHFTIGKNDASWPEEVRGFNLGNDLHMIRNHGRHKEIHQELTDIGVDLMPQIKTLTSEQVYNTLEIYKQIHGNVDVKAKYIVPESPDYPKYAWGYALGNCVSKIIKTGSHSLFSEQFKALGIEIKHKVLKSAKDVSFDGICEAIECYKAIHGHLNLSQQFVVPSDLTFPSHLHGIRLGRIVYEMSYSGTHVQHKDRLAQLGVIVSKRAVNVEQLGVC